MTQQPAGVIGGPYNQMGERGVRATASKLHGASDVPIRYFQGFSHGIIQKFIRNSVVTEFEQILGKVEARTGEPLCAYTVRAQ
jgi:hypothetical protein